MPRPASVTILALAGLCLSAFNLLGVASGWERRTFLRALPLSLPPDYLIVSAAAWAVIFAALAMGLWRLKRWARLGALGASLLYAAQKWFDRVVFARSDFSRETLPFTLALTVLSLALVWGLLLRRKVRQSFSA
jgi:hypothetical protein